jgi:hypothetical protein
MTECLDSLVPYFAWRVARNLDSVMLSLWWVLPTASLAAFILALPRDRLAWKPNSASIGFGLVPFLILLCVALVTPFASRCYSAGRLAGALFYVFVWVGLFHTICMACSAIWALGKAPSRGRMLLVLAALHLAGALWVRVITVEHHSGPFFQTGG